MKKYVLVEVPESTETVDISACKSPQCWAVKHIPVLEGKRALLEECLKMGEFRGMYVLPQIGSTFIGLQNHKVALVEATCNYEEYKYVVLTDPD